MRTGRCPSCDSTQIGALESLPEETASYQALGTTSYKPTWVVIGKDGNPKKTASGSTTTAKVGTIDVRVCGGCGRLEHFVQDPQWIPFARLRGFSWVSDQPNAGDDR